MEIATSAAGTLGADGVKAALKRFWKQVSYVLDYKHNLEDLNSRIVALTDARSRLQHQVEASRNRLEEIYEDVETWLKLADDGISKAKAILEEDQKAKKSCCAGLVPNIKERHKYSRRAKKEAPRIETLEVKGGGFDEVGYVVPPAGIVPPRGYEAFESRAGVFGAVVQALKEADVVGVWGPGGVGKTTLAKKVAESVKAEGIFTIVAMATIGQNPHINTIQREIAEWLGFEMKEETTAVRASQLLERLKQEKSNILIVLDDIWKMVDLDAIGVPHGGDKNLCKILLTSRNQQVLADMDVRPDHCFPINVLTKEEGWNFFQKNVAKMQDTVLVTEIVVRCGGLPVLILPVANALKNKKLFEWKDALEELKKGDFEENAFPLLELSYKFLKKDEKSLFLLCGQVGPKNISFSKLFIYSIGLGFFTNYDTLEKAKNRLRTLVNNLRRSSLLENDEKTIQMHDVVHSFAISKQHSVIVVDRDGQLTEWPRRDVLENCTSLSCEYFMNHPQILHCPRLEVLTLANVDFSGISQNFFSETKELRVLDLQAIRLSHLPSSFGFLMNLETLCLRDCKVEDISLIGDLEKLQVLCLSLSELVYLPSACGRLTRLRLLDLSYCYKLEMIAPNVLSCLTQLEELLMIRCPLRWEFQDEHSGRKTANLNELKSLPKLTRLEIVIEDANIIPNNWFSTKLESFKIFFGDAGYSDRLFEMGDDPSRFLNLIRLQTNDWPMKEVSAVVKRTEDLYMERLSGFGDDICKLDMEGFLPLKRLSIIESHDIRYVVNTTERGYPAHTIFPILESLRIKDLPHMERICHGLLRKGSLSKLRELRLSRCDALKNLFSVSILRTLTRLQEIDIMDCPIMTEIAVEDGKYNSLSGEEETVELPQLHSLCLRELPRLTSICSTQNLASTSSRSQDIASDNNVESSSGSFFFNKVAFPNLERLTLDSIGAQKIWDNRFFKSYSGIGNLTSLYVRLCPNLKYLFPSSMIKSLVQLRELEIWDCDSMKEIILSEDNVEKVTMVFPKLESLRMNFLRNLVTICTSCELLEFPKLESLYMYDLQSLVTICTSCELLEFPSLKLLHIWNCRQLKTFVKGEPSTTTSALFDHKVLFPKLEDLHIHNIGEMDMIWHEKLHVESFGKLKSLRIYFAPALRRIFSSSMLRRIQNLNTLNIFSCDLLEDVFDSHILVNEDQPAVVTELKTIDLHYLLKLKHVWPVGLKGIVSFQNLTSVGVYDCKQLKSVFPASMCVELFQLERLEIKKCGMEHIIAMEEDGKYNSLSGEEETVELPQLHDLYLGDLPQLTSICSTQNLASTSSRSQDIASDNNVESSSGSFFFNKVAFPNLECLTLVSIGALKIWDNRFFNSYSGFGNITSLSVERCHNLKYLFPSSVIKSLVQLRGLEISHCDSMKEIILSEDNVEKVTMVFPKLESLDMFGLRSLVTICTSCELLKFPSLELLHIKDCSQLKTFVKGEHSTTTSTLFDHKVAFPNLKRLTLVSVGALKIWDNRFFNSYSGIGNITSLSVERCHNLKYLFPSSVIKSLVQLRGLDIRHCDSMKEIILSEDNVEKVTMVFPKLELLKMHDLRSLLTICTSCELLEFPSLELLHIKDCSQLKTFVKGEPSTTTSALFDHKVLFPKLEDLEIEYMEELEMIWHEQLHVESFGKLKSLKISGAPALRRIFPSSMLRRIQNLNTFTISLCDSLEEVFDSHILVNEDQPAVVIELKTIDLSHLPELKHIWPVGLKGIVSFQNLTSVQVHDCEQLKSIFPASICVELFQLERLEIKKCGMEHIIAMEEVGKYNSLGGEEETVELPQLLDLRLRELTSICSTQNLASTSSRSQDIASDNNVESSSGSFFFNKVAFPNLERLPLDSIGAQKIWDNRFFKSYSGIRNLSSLSVERCPNLKYLFPSSMIKSLVQLRELEIWDCDSMKEIILSEDNVEKVPMVFPKLESLYMYGLPSLLTICTSCELLEFPSLKLLKIWNCRQLKTFVKGEPSTTTSALFDHKVLFPKLEDLEIEYMEELEMIWHEQLHVESFGKLKRLEISWVPGLRRIFQSSMLRKIQNLNTLTIAWCNSLEDVFDSHILVNEDQPAVVTELKTIDLSHLPELKHIWPVGLKGIVSFQNLTSVQVHDCEQLKSIFPASICVELFQLKRLDIKKCGMEHIIAVEEGFELRGTDTFKFPCLEYVILHDNSTLRGFYPEKRLIYLPALAIPFVVFCPMLEIEDIPRSTWIEC